MRRNHPLAILLEVLIDVTLVALIWRAVRQREWSLAFAYSVMLTEHIKQLLGCYRTVGNSQREWITVSFEVCVGLYALTRGDYISAGVMSMGVLVHFGTIMDGSRVGYCVCL